MNTSINETDFINYDLQAIIKQAKLDRALHLKAVGATVYKALINMLSVEFKSIPSALAHS